MCLVKNHIGERGVTSVHLLVEGKRIIHDMKMLYTTTHITEDTCDCQIKEDDILDINGTVYGETIRLTLSVKNFNFRELLW